MAASHGDDLDQLLDSALDDFQSLNLARPAPERTGGDKEKEEDSALALPAGVQGLGMGLPDLKSKKKGKQTTAAASNDTHVAEALDKLMEQTKEAVIGLESVNGSKGGGGGGDNKDALVEDWVKQFEELASGQDMASLVETMMQQLLSKEILHEPMKEIEGRYPTWLKDHESSLSKEDYGRYSKQYELIKVLNEVYESDPSNYTRITELMQKMQECGQPPDEIIRELAPDLDLATLGQLTPEMLDSQQNCSIM